MLTALKNLLSFKKKTVWIFEDKALAGVKPGQTIVANYGFMEKDQSHEFTKLEDNLWLSKDGQKVDNHEIFMPFTVLETTSH